MGRCRRSPVSDGRACDGIGRQRAECKSLCRCMLLTTAVMQSRPFNHTSPLVSGPGDLAPRDFTRKRLPEVRGENRSDGRTTPAAVRDSHQGPRIFRSREEDIYGFVPNRPVAMGHSTVSRRPTVHRSGRLAAAPAVPYAHALRVRAVLPS
jgi:hypothetical protein